MRRFSFFICVLFHFFGSPLFGQSPNQQTLYEVGVRDSLYSAVLEEQRTIYVHVPESYSQDGNITYPVAFILDGRALLPTVAEVQKYYSGGFTPEMILVGVVSGEHRTRDYTPSEVSELWGMPVPYATGGAPQFLDFFEQELIPYVEANYPATRHRTLIGHSYGGLFTLYSLLEKPDLFGNYIAIDPSLDWDGQYLLSMAKMKFPVEKLNQKSLFVSLNGQLHPQDASVNLENIEQDTSEWTLFARSNLQFSNLARLNSDNGLQFHWKFYPNDLHGTIVFPSIMDGLISCFDWYQMESTYQINNPATPTNEIKSIIESRAKKLELNFGYSVPPYPEELLNMSGYMSMDFENFGKAKMYFDQAIRYYPSSPNVYDSMADYFERTEDYKAAYQQVQRAYELSGSLYYENRMAELQEKF